MEVTKKVNVLIFNICFILFVVTIISCNTTRYSQLFNTKFGYLQFNTENKTIETIVSKKKIKSTLVVKIEIYEPFHSGKWQKTLFDTTFESPQLLKNFNYQFANDFFKTTINLPEEFEIFVTTDEGYYYSYQLNLKKSDLIENKIMRFKLNDYIRNGQAK
jgi:hypothetical protein